jgi:hypothetical protein
MASAIHPTQKRQLAGWTTPQACPPSRTQRDINMLQVQQLHQYYGGSHILRGLSFEAKVAK